MRKVHHHPACKVQAANPRIVFANNDVALPDEI